VTPWKTEGISSSLNCTRQFVATNDGASTARRWRRTQMMPVLFYGAPAGLAGTERPYGTPFAAGRQGLCLCFSVFLGLLAGPARKAAECPFLVAQAAGRQGLCLSFFFFSFSKPLLLRSRSPSGGFSNLFQTAKSFCIPFASCRSWFFALRKDKRFPQRKVQKREHLPLDVNTDSERSLGDHQ
jgi:hypothetical protein